MAAAERHVEKFEGKRASGGMAVGPAYQVGGWRARDQPGAGTYQEEISRLRSAITDAGQALESLADASNEMAAEILGIQIALLEDEALAAPAFQRIMAGGSAAESWRIALDRQIADYAASKDTYFRARADDLADLRDRVLAKLVGIDLNDRDVPNDAIIIGRDLTPSRFLAIDWQRAHGLALSRGSVSSHVAMLARARALPMAVGLGDGILQIRSGEPIMLDAEAGTVIRGLEINALEQTRSEIDSRGQRTELAGRAVSLPAITPSGERVTVSLNVDDPSRLAGISAGQCDGIGLTRTEFLFHGRADLPGEDEQVAVYRRILTWAKGRPVTIRTLDGGGDKPIPGLTVADESNPFLGLRGLRLSLARPAVFEEQLRALARASADGPLRVMFPMVTIPAEFEQARAMMTAAIAAVEQAGCAAGRPAIGMMVEVPAAAIAIDRFDAEFFSIGSNDLIQYVMASSRDSPHVSSLYDPLNQAVLSLIAKVADHGRAAGIEVSVCGDMAAEPESLIALLDCGIRSISVAEVALARVKAAIAGYDIAGRGHEA